MQLLWVVKDFINGGKLYPSPLAFSGYLSDYCTVNSLRTRLPGSDPFPRSLAFTYTHSLNIHSTSTEQLLCARCYSSAGMQQ